MVRFVRDPTETSFDEEGEPTVNLMTKRMMRGYPRGTASISCSGGDMRFAYLDGDYVGSVNIASGDAVEFSGSAGSLAAGLLCCMQSSTSQTRFRSCHSTAWIKCADDPGASERRNESLSVGSRVGHVGERR